MVQRITAARQNQEKQFVLNALLQHNYLPHIKSRKEDIPPSLTTVGFTEQAARAIDSSPENSQRKSRGYDAVEYKLTRYSGVPRLLSIPHPKAYAGLVLSISNNWTELSYITQNNVSLVTPAQHSDGRLVIMDYDTVLAGRLKNLKTSFGHRYVVRADISNFYASIYSHTLPWAIVGVEQAKQSIGSKQNKWYDKLDKAIRVAKRNETNGVAVGPGTSSIIAEAILAKVDAHMVQKQYTFIRAVDDYMAFCASQDDAERFVFELSEELAKYKLMLNIGKTAIEALPMATSPNWVTVLDNAIGQSGAVSEFSIVNYLDSAIVLARSVPDGSVLKYALRSLINRMASAGGVSDDVLHTAIQYALNLSYYHPVLIPLLGDLFVKIDLSKEQFRYDNEVQGLLAEHVRHRRSDAISWLLYYCIKYGVPVMNDTAKAIVATEDCIPMLFLYLTDSQQHKRQVVMAAKQLTQNNHDLYTLDQHWLLFYQLFIDNRMPNPYQQSSTFDILKKHRVNFVNHSL